jgi:alkylation response protein AidB-like acyl-CoA dehydrogenase
VDLSLSDDQEQLVEAFRAFFTKECPPAVVRAGEETGGFDRSLWVAFGALGGPAMGVGAASGGGGATLLDLELVAEQYGAALAPIPFVEGLVAGRVLTAGGESTRGFTDRLNDEPPALATIALHPARDGQARLVPAGAVATMVVGIDDGDLVVIEAEPPATGPVRNLGDLSIADRSLRSDGRAVVASGTRARELHQRALDEWRVLTAGALVGLADAALTLGVEYAKQRHQFGVPIGSFQSLAHGLADAATAVDGARLLTREAAWAADEAEPNAAALAGMAFLFAARSAQRTSATSLHVHGGYGFTLEYDIQLYHRRAKAWPLLLGDPRRGALHLADVLFGPAEHS